MELSCPLCLSPEAEELHGAANTLGVQPPRQVVRCTQCRLTFVHPRMTPDELRETYGEKYFRLFEEVPGMELTGGDEEVAPHLKARLATCERLVGKGRLLEVGCAYGGFLDYARRSGWNIQGVEVSSYAADEARRRFSIDVFCGTLEEAGFPDEFFDLCHMNHVLEHLATPLGTLREVYRVLRKGGLLAVEVPNELEDLYGTFREKILGRPRIPPPAPSVHLLFFNPLTLTRMLGAAGFKVIHLQTPRRNKDQASKFPFGILVKKAIYSIEETFKCGPLIEAFAQK